VILLDANLLIHATIRSFRQHRRAREWLAPAVAWIAQAGEQHAGILARCIARPGVRAGLVHDAHLAALAIEHGLILCSADGNFARFDGLRWYNPLA
jgi:predicted nucleic acid-binding protein